MVTTPLPQRNRIGGGKASRRRIVFLASSDPLDVHSFSSTLYYMVQALRAEFPDLDILRHSRSGWFPLLRTVARRAGLRSDPYYWRPLNRIAAALLGQRWSGERMLLICVVNSTLAAELGRRFPLINISDATFQAIRGLYDFYASMDEKEAARAEAAELGAIRNAVHNSFSSPWAARSAIEDYGADPSRVSVIPWGCNFPAVDPPEEPWDGDKEPCRLLFVGCEWQRKGGDIVLETARLLRERGFSFVLDLVGSSPPEGAPDLAGVTAHGLLSKADPQQLDRLLELNRRAAFLFLPTRQDCTPMVFAEANAYGTPALTRDVGGVGGVVEDGSNGILLAADATPADFADAIIGTWSDQAGYRRLRRSARAHYEQRLNWAAWARSLKSVIERLEQTGEF